MLGAVVTVVTVPLAAVLYAVYNSVSIPPGVRADS